MLTPSRSSDGGSGPNISVMRFSWWKLFAPGSSGRPMSISANTHPKDQISIGVLYGAATIASGAL